MGAFLRYVSTGKTAESHSFNVCRDVSTVWFHPGGYEEIVHCGFPTFL